MSFQLSHLAAREFWTDYFTVFLHLLNGLNNRIYSAGFTMRIRGVKRAASSEGPWGSPTAAAVSMCLCYYYFHPHHNGTTERLTIHGLLASSLNKKVMLPSCLLTVNWSGDSHFFPLMYKEQEAQSRVPALRN